MAEDPFNVSLAQQYRDSARTELEAAGVTFPIKILLPYNPAVINWSEECGVAKQQLEDALGTDFIEVIVERGPDTGFLSSVRRSGKYALLLCNYGADFADPATYAEPFVADNTYNFWDKSNDPEIKKLFSQYSDLITQGMMTYDDIDKRYDYYAQAEALLIEHAIICPSRVSNGEGYVADRLSRYKGMIIHENSMSMEEFNAAYAKWDTERLANDQ